MNLLIFGASVRAAALSALRAGLEPWCADLFADVDLAGRCSVIQVPFGEYPQAFRSLISRDLPGPWMYTGALENHRLLVSELARLRPLWGNDEEALNPCRMPELWTQVLHDAGVPCPRIRLAGDAANAMLPRGSADRWLVKPIQGASGVGIHFWSGRPMRADRQVYLQEYIEGEPCSALYLGRHRQAQLLGVSRQLIAEPWLHAGPFRYCGSIGPLPLDEPVRRRFEALGQALAAGCGIRGLFGVDCVLAEGVPWPVEINPRYTASVEVLELASGTALLDLHRSVFEPERVDELEQRARNRPARMTTLGKGILFARDDLVFPERGPWLAALGVRDPWAVPPFADIPPAESAIRKGKPILTILVEAQTVAECQERLRRQAVELDRILFG